MTDEVQVDTAATSGDQTPQDDKGTKPDAAPADDKGKKTIVDGNVADVDPAPDEKPADDWRIRMAGGDEKELKKLSRYASEADVYKAYRELEKKKSSGELKAALPKGATDEQIAEWRKDNGIPEAPDKYDLSFDNGLVIGEQDKPFIDEFVGKMHGENATPAQVKAAIASYYEMIGRQQQARAEADADFEANAREALREEWGGDYKRNIGAVDGFLGSLSEEVREKLANSRTPSGELIGNDPDIIKWLAATAYEINPAATLMPSSINNPGAAISDEISSIEKMVGDKGSEYWNGPKDSTGNTKMQIRYAELLAARDKIAARG